MSVAEDGAALQTGRRRAAGELRSDLVRYLPSQVLPAVVGVVTIPIVTRLLTPGEFGNYRLILAAVGLFASAGSWIPASIYRFFPEAEKAGSVADFRSTVRRLLVVTIVSFSALWLLGMAVLRPFMDFDRWWLFVVSCALMAMGPVFGVAVAQIRAVREVNWYSVTAVLNKVLTLGLGVGLVVGVGMRVEGMIYGSIAASLVLLPGLYRVRRRHMPALGRYSRTLARAMMRFGIPLGVVQLVSWALNLSDRFVLEIARGEYEVGLYAAASGVAEQAMLTLLTMFMLPFAVLGARVWERDGPDVAADFIADSCRSYLLLAVPALAGISILAFPVMVVMTDAPFHDASVILPVVALAYLFQGTHYWYSAGPSLAKKTGHLVTSSVVGVVVNVGLNFLLLGRYGYQAAAYTTLAAYVAALVTMVWLARQTVRWTFPGASLVRAGVASAVMVATIWGITLLVPGRPTIHLAVGVPVGAAVYGLALAILGEPQARTLLRRLVRRRPT